MKSIEVVQRFYQMFGQQDLNGAFGLLHESVSWELIGPNSIPYFGNYKGPEGVRQFFDLLFKVEQVIEFMPEEFVDGGDTVCVVGREKCLAKATGRTFEAKWIHLFTCQDGKIIRWREYIDTAAITAAYTQ